jgi:hypothetical protein
MLNPMTGNKLRDTVEGGTTWNQVISPSGAAPATLTGGSAGFAQGALSEVLNGTEAGYRVLRGVVISAITGIHEVVVYTGAAGSEVEIARIRVAAVGFYPLSSEILNETRLCASTGSTAGGGQTCSATLVFGYRE